MEGTQIQLDDLLAEIIGYTRQTYEALKEWWPYPIVVYTFLYYTAKRQKTNQPKATLWYIATWTWLSEKTIRKAKAYLKSINLIEDVQTRDEKGQVNWRFVKVKNISSTLPKNHRVDEPQGGFVPTNAWNPNNKMLKANNNKMLGDIDPMKLIKDEWSDEMKKTRDDFKQMRKEIKKPLTSSAEIRIWNKLKKMSKSQTWYIRILETSIIKNWSDVYDPEEKNKAKVFVPTSMQDINKRISDQKSLVPQYSWNVMNRLEDIVEWNDDER